MTGKQIRRIDVGPRFEVHGIVGDLAGKCCAIVVIGWAMPAVMRFSGCILAIDAVRVIGECDVRTVTGGAVVEVVVAGR